MLMRGPMMMQCVCGFRVWELVIAFFLCAFHQLKCGLMMGMDGKSAS